MPEKEPNNQKITKPKTTSISPEPLDLITEFNEICCVMMRNIIVILNKKLAASC